MYWRRFQKVSVLALLGLALLCPVVPDARIPLQKQQAHARAAHPFHFSVAEVEHNAKTKRLEFSIKFFTQDLEEALEKTIGKAITLGKGHELEPALLSYMQLNFSVSEGGKPVPLTWHGKELQNDVTWLYIETPALTSTKLTVRHTALCELFDDQRNLMNLKGEGWTSTLLFGPTKPTQILSLP